MARSRFTRAAALAGLGALVAALAGCATTGLPRPLLQAPDSWTILTYEIADTDLEPFMMEDVEEMGEVGTRPGLNLVSFVDRAEGYTEDPVLGIRDWVGAKVLEVQPGGGARELEDLGDVNTGDPQLLADFIGTQLRAYPAANYALIISDHGAAWPGVGGDESSENDSLTLDELRSAITDGLARAGVDKLDLLGFDACLMATAEVASTLAPTADYLVASQELEPGHGWDYTSLEAAYRGATPTELGSEIIRGFRAQALDQGTDVDITLSMIDLARIPDLDAALANFSSALTERVRDVAPTVGRTLASTLGFGASPDPASDSYMADLGGLAGQISVDALDVADEADAVTRALNDAVLDSVAGQATRGATGLSIYFPPSVDYFDEAYAAADGDTGWADFLTAYYSAGDAVATEDIPVFLSPDAFLDFRDGGVWASAAVASSAEAAISDATLYFGVLEDDGSISYLGEEGATVSDDGAGVVTGFWDLGVLSIDDGEDSARGYLDQSQDAEGRTTSIDVPLDYYAPDATDPISALLSLTIEPTSGTIVSETYYSFDDETGTYGELTVDPEGVIVPLIQVADEVAGEATWVGTTDVGLYAATENLRYTLETLPSGTQIVVELWITDFAGNSDVATEVVEIP